MSAHLSIKSSQIRARLFFPAYNLSLELSVSNEGEKKKSRKSEAQKPHHTHTHQLTTVNVRCEKKYSLFNLFNWKVFFVGFTFGCSFFVAVCIEYAVPDHDRFNIWV